MAITRKHWVSCPNFPRAKPINPLLWAREIHQKLFGRCMQCTRARILNSGLVGWSISEEKKTKYCLPPKIRLRPIRWIPKGRPTFLVANSASKKKGGQLARSKTKSMSAKGEVTILRGHLGEGTGGGGWIAFKGQLSYQMGGGNKNCQPSTVPTVTCTTKKNRWESHRMSGSMSPLPNLHR